MNYHRPSVAREQRSAWLTILFHYYRSVLCFTESRSHWQEFDLCCFRIVIQNRHREALLGKDKFINVYAVRALFNLLDLS
jgi:hypothetical protein